MKSGRLRHMIELQKYCTVTDAHGQPSREWLRHAIAWGAIDAITGREGFDSARLTTETTLKVTVRWSPGMADATTKDRLCSSGKSYSITGIVPMNTEMTEMIYLVSGFEDGR